MDDKWLDILMKVIFSTAAIFLIAMTVAVIIGIIILINLAFSFL